MSRLRAENVRSEVVMSPVLSNTSVKVFFGTKTWGGVARGTTVPLLRRLCRLTWENAGSFSRLFTVKPLTSFIQLFSLKVLLRSVAISIPRISTALSCKLCFLTNSALANTAAALPSDVGLIWCGHKWINTNNYLQKILTLKSLFYKRVNVFAGTRSIDSLPGTRSLSLSLSLSI